MPLAETLRDRRIFTAIAGWTIVNVLLAVWGGPMLTEAGGIAWEAHLGGFYAGLLLYGFFDRPPRARRGRTMLRLRNRSLAHPTKVEHYLRTRRWATPRNGRLADCSAKREGPCVPVL